MRVFGAIAFSTAGIAVLGLGVGAPSVAHASTSCQIVFTTPLYALPDPNSFQAGWATQGTIFNWNGNIAGGPDGNTYIQGVIQGDGATGWGLQSNFIC